MKFPFPVRLLLWFFCCGALATAADLRADESNAPPRFNIQGYLVNDTTRLLSTNLVPMLSTHTGTNLDVDEIVRAACDLQTEYARLGCPAVGIAIGEKEISNGIVTLNVFRSAYPQIRVSGRRYICSSNEVTLASNLPGAPVPAPPAVTNAALAAMRARPPTPEQIVLRKKIAELDLQERAAKIPPQPPPTTQLILAPVPFTDTNNPRSVLAYKMAQLDKEAMRTEFLPAPQTNSAPSTNTQVLDVKGYEVTGNSLLPTNLVELVLRPYIGTNITEDKIWAAGADLQAVYREEGFATVSVVIPPQVPTNNILKIRVFEGRLVEVSVSGNQYFSSNNIIRALPSLHPNMILTRPVFEAELDRANANQDRQIYPKINPGPVEGTSSLELDVKDRLPLHAKSEFNNENSPGTPDFRLNSSAEYGNFFQLEQTLGLQYSFSPQEYKQADNWLFYDQPLVANYSGFYRIPIGSPESISDAITTSTSFGYDEATRKFNLPPSSGQPELNIFASHSTIDTGLEVFPATTIFSIPGVRTITMQNVQEDLTINSATGFQWTQPLPEIDGIRSTLSASLNYKNYDVTTAKTNNFTITEYTVNANGTVNPPTISTVSSPVPLTVRKLDYLPLGLRYDGSLLDPLGLTAFGLGITVNAWYSGGPTNLHNVVGSTQAIGHWLTVNPSLSRDFNLHFPTNWTLSLHAEGQWANSPLVANEQYGSGGVNSVRGYHEGEVFGDTGWRVDAELKTPPHVVGLAYDRQPLTIRGSVFTDYSESYLLSEGGPGSRIPLWGAGIGGVATFGPHWEARLWFAVPFDSTSSTEALRPRFNFSLTGQF